VTNQLSKSKRIIAGATCVKNIMVSYRAFVFQSVESCNTLWTGSPQMHDQAGVHKGKN